MYRWCTLPAAMFCPQCKSEYRQGFTRCADCDVDLIASLPEAGEAGFNPARRGTLVRLWEGENLALHVKLREALEQVGIPYYDKPQGSYIGSRRYDPWPFYSRPKFGFEIAVLSSDQAAGKEVLEKLLAEEPEDMALPAEDHPPAPVPGREPFEERAATSEVWAGNAGKLASFLQDALQENEMVIKVEIAGAETKIYVRPSDEARAREIVREIVEGAPPE